MYDWRNMTPEERVALLEERRQLERPWHHPPHPSGSTYHLTAACYEHRYFIGKSPKRMGEFADALLQCLALTREAVHAWCVLPNHYHVLLTNRDPAMLKRNLGRLHGRSSHLWNVEEDKAGRKCFHGCLLKPIKSNRHRFSTLNYIHHNPVHHGYVEKWTDWPYSSVHAYLKQHGRETVKREWDLYPITGMGEGWDV